MFILKKKSSPEPAGQFKSNHTNYPWVKGILHYLIKGQVLFKGKIITKMMWGHAFKNSFFSRTTEAE
jgi:hypothetical protein